MSANTATISSFHADGVVKDGEKLFNYSFIEVDPTVKEAYDVVLRKHPASGKPCVAIIKKTVAGAAVSDSTQYIKSAEFLRDLKSRYGVSGSSDDIVESVAALVMTAAELTAAGTPVDSQLPNLPTGIDMAYETYTVTPKSGYLRAKAAVVAAAPYQVLAADTPTTGIDWMKVLLYFGIGTVVTIGGILIYKASRKKTTELPPVIRKPSNK